MWSNAKPLRTTSVVPDLKSNYTNSYMPFKVKENKKKKKEKPTIANFSFLGNSHYNTTFFGIGS